jgi:DNA gyrase subunit B
MGQEYTAKGIQVLKGLEGVRKRPAMYIGSTDLHGLHRMIYEVVDNSIDEAMAGHCDQIDISIAKDGSVTVSDNGRGIPVDIHPTQKRPAVEVVLTTLHAGGKFDHKSYKVSGGLHGVGVSVVNALSEWLEVEIWRDGKSYTQLYKQGTPAVDLKSEQQKGKKDRRGTRVTFYPDKEIFTTMEYSFDTLSQRFRELAFLNKGITINFEDQRSSKKHEFKYTGGIVSFVKFLNQNKDVLHTPPIYIDDKRDDFELECAIQYNDGYTDNIFAFANNINTVDGGTHLIGFKAALTRTLNNYAQKASFSKKEKITLSGDDIREGISAVLSVKLPDPQFEGQTKGKLGNSEIKGYVESVIGQKLGTRPSLTGSSRRQRRRRGRARRRGKRATSFGAKRRSRRARSPASSPIARSRTRPNARSTSSREIPRAARRSRGGTAASRRSCRSAARSSTSRKRASTRFSRTKRSKPSSRPSARGWAKRILTLRKRATRRSLL